MLTTLKIQKHESFTERAVALSPAAKRAITKLDLIGYDFSDLDLRAFVGFTNVKTLDVSYATHNGNKLNDDDFVFILLAFRYLTRFHAAMTALGNSSVPRLPKTLTCLNLSFTQISDEALAGFKALTQLERLNCQGTALTAKVAELAELAALTHLDIEYCQAIANPKDLAARITQPPVALLVQNSALLSSAHTETDTAASQAAVLTQK